jgi:ribosomal protein L16/L10AE
MLQPTRTKFRKAFKGRIHGVATSGQTLAFGEYGLKALEPERVNARQIEAARRALTRFMKRAGVEEADRSAHGQRQGQPGSLGGPREARPHPVRS